MKRKMENEEIKEHTLKTWNEYFQEVENGKKTFELRRNDRNFKEGDILILKSWDNITECYLGGEIRKRISCVLDTQGALGLEKGFVILGLESIENEAFKNMEEQTEHNTNVVAQFMEHCKENGCFVSYTMFESYFEA